MSPFDLSSCAIACRRAALAWLLSWAVPAPAWGEGTSSDLLIVTGTCGGSAWFLYNRGDATFHPLRFAGDMFDGIAVGDFDRNGTTDLGTGHGLFLGLGDGYFGIVGFLSYDESADCNPHRLGNAVAFSDMDGDGRQDLVYACGVNVYIFYGRADGDWLAGDRAEAYFESGPIIETNDENYGCDSPFVCEAGDIDENGFPDVYAGEVLYAPPLLYNGGDETFSAAWLPEHHDYPTRFIDLDGDGHLDVVRVESGYLTVNKGDGRGNFVRATYNPVALFGGSRLQDFAVADLDSDGLLDVAMLHMGAPDNGVPGAICILFGEPDGMLGHGGFIYLPILFGSEWVNASAIAAADLDGDGVEDLAVARSSSPAVHGVENPVSGVLLVYHGRGDGTFRGPTYSDGPADAERLYALGDFDRLFIRGDANDDGEVDISDAVAIFTALFFEGPVPCGKAMDVNDDGAANLTDVLGVLQYLFESGATPAAPFPAPGIDETDFYDELGCSPLTWELLQRRGR